MDVAHPTLLIATQRSHAGSPLAVSVDTGLTEHQLPTNRFVRQHAGSIHGDVAPGTGLPHHCAPRDEQPGTCEVTRPLGADLNMRPVRFVCTYHQHVVRIYAASVKISRSFDFPNCHCERTVSIPLADDASFCHCERIRGNLVGRRCIVLSLRAHRGNLVGRRYNVLSLRAHRGNLAGRRYNVLSLRAHRGNLAGRRYNVLSIASEGGNPVTVARALADRSCVAR